MPRSGSKRSTGSTRSTLRPDSAVQPLRAPIATAYEDHPSRALRQRLVYFADAFVGFGENGDAVCRCHAETQEGVNSLRPDDSRLGCVLRFGNNQTGNE